MPGIELDYSDVMEIFKENLKIENSVKSIQSIFLNSRFSNKINYKPYFQRNYVWDDEKATYFIESIILGTEIPPLVLFQTKNFNEVIDGRQRYETIERFIKDRFVLKEEGLKTFKMLTGKKYSQLDEVTKESFDNTKLRILQCSVVNEPSLSEEKEDKIKKEIFRRYNSGIIPLQKEEIERAEFIDDKMTNFFKLELCDNEALMQNVAYMFMPKSKVKAQKRDKINILLTRIRNLITLPLIPIYSYAHGSSKGDIVRKYYYHHVKSWDPTQKVTEFKYIITLLSALRRKLIQYNYFLSDSNLLYESCYWALSILLTKQKDLDNKIIHALAEALIDGNNNRVFWTNINEDSKSIETIFDPTGSHYYKSISNRFTFISNYFGELFSIDFSCYLKNSIEYKKMMETNVELEQFNRYKLNKTDPASITIFDIISDMEKSRFLIRPNYQRSEVTNQQKASYLLESIMLGIKIPPIFIFKRKDKVKEVIDGQQRLLTLLGFLGKPYLNENGEQEFSKKDQFKLSKLRILKELNGKNINDIDDEYEDRILDFPIDVVEIDESQNLDFNNIDLFLRLNTKPYPIKENTFEMWNAYVEKEIILEIKRIAAEFEGKIFRPKDSRMKNEELITSLAYLNYRYMKDKTKPIELLNIYLRNGRISARISSKENITKTLSDISKREDVTFLEAVRNVRVFLDKIKNLVSNDFSELGSLFSHKRKSTQSKTDQNFYFLWVMLNDISLQTVKTEPSKVFEVVSQKYSIIQNAPDDCNIEDFKESLEKIC